jgi:flagellar basal-body rod modification protein FlgD
VSYVNEAIANSAQKIAENHRRFSHLFTKGKGDDMSIETFYKLLMAEMSNQDPLDPMSNTEFISQMAAFTSLQVQQEALYYNNANYAQSLVGREVIVATNTGVGIDVQNGIVSRVNFSGGDFSVTVNGNEYPLKNIMEVMNRGHGAPSGSDGSFATSLIGKYVTVGWLDKGAPHRESGLVERIEIDSGVITVIIDNLSYPLQSVIKVEPREVYDEKHGNKTAENKPDEGDGVWHSSEG